VELLVVHLAQCCLPFGLVLEFEEGKAARLPGLTTEDDAAVGDFAKRREEISEFGVADLGSEVADEDTEGHGLERKWGAPFALQEVIGSTWD
jgi:hypothetical protein